MSRLIPERLSLSDLGVGRLRRNGAELRCRVRHQRGVLQPHSNVEPLNQTAYAQHKAIQY
jgi:hypothetical protein